MVLFTAALVAGSTLAPRSAPSDVKKAARPPRAAKRPVVDTYHGVKVVDDYRWLEDGTSPEVKAWVAAWSDYSRARLEALPGTARMAERLLGIDDAHPV